MQFDSFVFVSCLYLVDRQRFVFPIYPRSGISLAIADRNVPPLRDKGVILQSNFDVIVVGQSLAAYIAALGFAHRQRRVAFVSTQAFPRPDALLPQLYLLPRTIRSFARIGLGPELAALAHAQQGWQLRTPAGPIVHHRQSERAGFYVHRFRLYELLQRQLRTQATVTYFSDHDLVGLLDQGHRVIGVQLRDLAGKPVAVTGKLVVAADGFCSQVASMADVPEVRVQNGRFGFYGYFLSPMMPPTMWLRDPDVATVIPDEGGLVLALAMPTRDKQLAFQRDPPAAFLDYFAGFPGTPEIRKRYQQSPIRPVLQNDLISRPPIYRGMALIGAAALANDLLWGLNDSWSADSAFLLVRQLSNRLAHMPALAAGLQRYKKGHQRMFRQPQRWMRDYASGRRFNLRERWLLAAAVTDDKIAATLLAVLYGETSATAIMNTFSVLRIGTVNAQQVARRTTHMLTHLGTA